jgi:hypothetical protein
MSKKYKKKPVVIEAVRWTGSNFSEIKKFMGDTVIAFNEQSLKISVKTLEGVITASPNDYIIKGIAGEFYPCKPKIFEETYEEVEE